MSVELQEPSVVQLDPAMRRIGTVLDGKWTLDRLLGVGGMAAVYAATHRNGARAAIKLFPFSVTTSPEFAERILREGYLANKIGHSAVVRVLDDHLDREREYAYLVMELLEGETARQRIERTGPMSPLEAIDFLIELSDCLATAHEKGVVHRDIKPENLFLTTDDALKVLDFGVARAVDGTSSFATRTGAALGTPAYMSPEQARGKPSEISPRSDLYAAGATLLFLLAGEFLHEGESAQEIMVRAAWTPARKMAERNLGLPDSIGSIIDRACAFDPADRYQSAAELRKALEEARHELLRSPLGTTPLVRPSRPAPAQTAPTNPARSRPSDETLVDRTPPPPDGSSMPTVADDHRRRNLAIGGTLTLAVAVGLAIAWPRGPESPPPAVGTAALAAEPSAPPPAAPESPKLPLETAPPPEPSASAQASAGSAATKPRVRRTAAATPPTGSSPAPAARPAAVRPAAADRPKSPSMGRDVGY